jgi:hypothetical protein
LAIQNTEIPFGMSVSEALSARTQRFDKLTANGARSEHERRAD